MKDLLNNKIISGILLTIVSFVFVIMNFIIKDFHPTMSSYLCNLATEIIGIIITLWFIQHILEKNEEQKEMQEELKKILRYNEIITVFIAKYFKSFYCIVTPIDKRFKEYKIPSDFKIQDLQDLHSTSLMITNDIFQPAIEIFYKDELQLRDIFSDTLKNIDFKYFPKIGELLLNFVQQSLANDVKEAIINRKNMSPGVEDVKKMLISDYIDNHYQKFKENTLGANSATPYFILYDLLHIEYKIITQYQTEIQSILKNK